MSEIREHFSDEEQFDNRKREYFSRLGLRLKESFRMHKEAGLWERKDGKRDWGNVSEHCLVIAARAEVLADKLNLPENVKKDLMIAAALHDFFKKGQKEIVTANNLTWDSFGKAAAESASQIRKAGFNERIVQLAGSTGAEDSIENIEALLDKKEMSEEDIACLVMYYVDGYTIGSDWVNPAEVLADGRQINNLDRRIDKDISNPRYAKLNEEGRIHFDGETLYDVQRRVENLTEQRLAGLISNRGGQPVKPKDLPQSIDKEIQDRIMAEA